MGFRDGHGRDHDEMRVSVTDRCNLRCDYCIPEEPVWFPRAEILSYEEIVRLARVASGCGVRRFRITGGEPLLRRNLPDLIRQMAATPGVEELSVTTNGLLLAGMARPLADAGLHRVNVSLDTLDRERFRTLTRRDGLEKVLVGLEAAATAGLSPVKLNTVLLRGVNDDEIVPMAAAARERGWELRFIEFMPLENGRTWDMSRVVPGSEVRERIHGEWPFDPDPEGDSSGPAVRYLYRDGAGAVGFINSVTEPFCESCSRIRLTCDGKLTVCLYGQEEADLKAALRGEAADGEIARLIAEAVGRKGRGGALEIFERRDPLPLVRTMHQIGG